MPIEELLEAGRDKATVSGVRPDARPLARPFLQIARYRISKALDPAASERAARFPRIHDSEILARAAIRCSPATDLARIRVLARTDSRIQDSAGADLATEVSAVSETGDLAVTSMTLDSAAISMTLDLAGASGLVAGVAASVGADLAWGLTGAGAASVSVGAPRGYMGQIGVDIGERRIILTRESGITTRRGAGLIMVTTHIRP